MELKRKFNFGIFTFLISLIGLSLSISSCKKNEGETVKVYEYREQIGKKIKELNDLLLASTFGYLKDMYPETSRKLLEDSIADLKKLLEEIKVQTVAVNNVPQETSNRINAVNAVVQQFLATKRTQDLIVPAELHVNGKSGGYIDFGYHPEFSKFTNGFTVETWVKFVDLGSFDFILSTFIDNQYPQDNYRYGWAVNYFGEGGNSLMRMSYALGKSDLFEPGINGFSTKNQWLHLAYVWNPAKTADGSSSPATFKMYINGDLVKQENWGQTNYTPNLQGTRLIGLNHCSFDGAIAVDGKGTNGYMKHMHIWNSVKSQASLQTIMNSPESVTGTETDLVCGWKFTQIAYDDNNIKDITGKYTAKLGGNYKWKEL